MLEYKNNLLSISDEVVTSADYVLTLNTDLNSEATIFGELLLSNGSSNIVQFTNFKENIFKARLQLTESSKPFLLNANFKLLIVDVDNTKESNSVKLDFNLEKIEFSINKNKSEEIKKLYLKLNSLESIINHLANGHTLDNINIINKDYIKKGMIVQAIDDNGNFVAVYPFLDMVKEINGQKAINNSIILDASMIKYNQEQSIKEYIGTINEVITTIKNLIDTQKELLISLRKEVNEVKLKIEQHINDGII